MQQTKETSTRGAGIARYAHLGMLLLLAGCAGADDAFGGADDEGMADEDLGVAEQAVVAVTDGDYVIKAAHSGKCLDIASASTADGAAVQQWDCNGTAAQVFRVISLGDGYARIVNPNSGKALDVAEVSTADGALIQQWTYGGGANQQFEIFDAGGGQHGIRARHSNKVLDVKEVSTASGARIHQWGWVNGSNQRWIFQKLGGAGNWNLVWADEFNGANGSPVDGSKWTLETGGGGWGNNELQYYTNSTNNARQENGNLVITATPQNAGQYGCWYGTCQYTSARLITRSKYEHTYGRVEARIKIPRGQGLWPAFWMLGNDIGSAGWPSCGEIDIMENVGSQPSVLHGSLHGPGYSGGSPLTGTYTLPGGAALADAFHTYAVEWEPGVVRWYIDNTLYSTKTTANLPAGTNWVYNHPFFMLLNVAVGGNWPGSPNSSTSFPQQMLVDYVRVYQR